MPHSRSSTGTRAGSRTRSTSTDSYTSSKQAREATALTKIMHLVFSDDVVEHEKRYRSMGEKNKLHIQAVYLFAQTPDNEGTMVEAVAGMLESFRGI